jgi:glucosamine--fructose-6-phosphate aminotransferase (isomerizing)
LLDIFIIIYIVKVDLVVLHLLYIGSYSWDMYTKTILYREIFEQPAVLSGLLQDNQAIIDKIAIQVKANDIKHIVVVGRGSSGHACDYFVYLTEIFTKYLVKDLNPSIVTSYDGSVSLDNSLVIGVSQSGMAPDVLMCLQKAVQCKSIVVSITNNLDSPIAKVADYHLYCNAGVEKSIAATKSFSASMYLLMLIVRKLSDDSLFKEAPKNIVLGVTQLLKYAEDIVEVAKQLVNTKDMFVLSRGLNLAIAKESALKLSETSYIKAFGWSVAEFRHGPFAMVDSNTTALIFAPSGRLQQEILAMVDKLRAEQAKVIVVGDVFADQTYKVSPDIVVPDGTEIETPFYNIVVAQLIANYVSSAKGIDTDNPRGLSKVTLTK